MISLICTGNEKEDKTNMKMLCDSIYERASALYNATSETKKTK